VRDNPTKTIHRVFHYGDLADIIMLDTRLEGRSPQVEHVADADARHRSMLGASQLNWFKKELKNSKAQWKVIGQQVVFSELNMGWAMPYFEDKAESSFLDIWDGYSAERDDIINYIDQENIEDVVILTGDIHASFAFDVVQNSTDLQHYGNGKGAVAVEFAATSISSANADEHIPLERVQLIEKCMNQPCDQMPFYSDKNPNPHLKYVDLDRHGYFILDLKPQKAQANWYFIRRPRTRARRSRPPGSSRRGRRCRVWRCGTAPARVRSGGAPPRPGCPPSPDQPEGKAALPDAAP